MTLVLASVLVFAGTSSPSKLLYNQPTTSLNATLSSLVTGSSYNITTPNIVQSNNVPITFTVTGSEVAGNVLTTSGTTSTITVVTNVDYTQLKIGSSYTGNIVINQQSGNDTVTIPVEFVSSFCSNGEKGGNLEISNVEFDNNDGEDDEWSPFDELEISVEVTNNGNVKIKEVVVELGLYNSNGKNIVKDMDELEDRKIKLGSINDDNEETATFKFKVPADFEEDNYKLVIKAYSDNLNEENECTSKIDDFDTNDFYQSIDGVREEEEEKHIIFSNINVSPSPVQCGEKVQVTGEIFNIGDEDYEDQVRVTLVSDGLKLNTEKIVREDFSQGDSKLIDFEFDVPVGTTEKLYNLEFRTYYDYNKDTDKYHIISEDKFTTSLKVTGNCNVQKASVVITADLNPETPEVVAGKKVIIDTKLSNTGDIPTTYIVSVSGNSEWSILSSIEPQSVNLNPGESKDVSIAINVDEDASGDKELTIRAVYNEQISEQKVILTINETKSESNVSVGPFFDHIKNNWFIYLIVIVNVILIIAIILVIRSMVSPRPL
mgnify:CR=1 FL=1